MPRVLRRRDRLPCSCCNGRSVFNAERTASMVSPSLIGRARTRGGSEAQPARSRKVKQRIATGDFMFSLANVKDEPRGARARLVRQKVDHSNLGISSQVHSHET